MARGKHEEHNPNRRVDKWAFSTNPYGNESIEDLQRRGRETNPRNPHSNYPNNKY